MLGDEREELIQSQEVLEGQVSNVQVCAVIREIERYVIEMQIIVK
jgi:hypothetical protein